MSTWLQRVLSGSRGCPGTHRARCRPAPCVGGKAPPAPFPHIHPLLPASLEGTRHSAPSCRSSALLVPHHGKAIDPAGLAHPSSRHTHCSHRAVACFCSHLSQPASIGWGPGTPLHSPFQSLACGAPTDLLCDRGQLSFTYRCFLSCHKEEDLGGGVKKRKT